MPLACWLGDPVHELILKLICEVREVTESGLLSKVGDKLVAWFVRLRGHLAKTCRSKGMFFATLDWPSSMATVFS